MILSKMLAIHGFLWIHTNVTRQVLFVHNFWLNEGEMRECRSHAGAMQEVEAVCRMVLPPNEGDLAYMMFGMKCFIAPNSLRLLKFPKLELI